MAFGTDNVAVGPGCGNKGPQARVLMINPRSKSDTLLGIMNIPLQYAVLKLSSSFSLFFARLHLALTRYFTFPRRNYLPPTLFDWKHLAWYHDMEIVGRYVHLWGCLEPFFSEHQYTLFPRLDVLNQYSPHFPAPSNYIYYPANGSPVQAATLREFGVMTTVLHAARKDNRHYVIRVMSIGKQGSNHLHIMRMLSNTVPDNLYSNFHILPMLDELVYRDITFGVFPFVSGQITSVLVPHQTKCTLEDALHVIMQCLEAIIYIHGKNIAHRDCYLDNFLIDFWPESLLGQHWARPRVYLTDFESAIHFSDDVKPSERLVSGFPFEVEDFGLDRYNRKSRAPELLIPEPHMYCPFSLDMFQFGSDLVRYLMDTECDEVDALWPPLMSENPAERPTAQDIFKSLGDFINSTPPKNLQRTWTSSLFRYVQ